MDEEIIKGEFNSLPLRIIADRRDEEAAAMAMAVALIAPLVPSPRLSPMASSRFLPSSPIKLSRHSRPPQHNLKRCLVRCESGATDEKVPFGYTRKDVLLIGLGLTVFGVGLKYGLEFVGVDPLKAGNVVQLVMVLGLTIGWVSTYIFRVSSKEMTYAKQLKDYEEKVIQKRLEELPEAELESLLAQVEEEKRQLKAKRENISN